MGILADVFDDGPPIGDPCAVGREALAKTATTLLVPRTGVGIGETLHGASAGIAVGAVAHENRATTTSAASAAGRPRAARSDSTKAHPSGSRQWKSDLLLSISPVGRDAAAADSDMAIATNTTSGFTPLIIA